MTLKIQEYRSFKYINTSSLKVGSVHPVWSTVNKSIIDSKRVQLKCKLLTGTCILYGNKAEFNQYTVDATGKLLLLPAKCISRRHSRTVKT